MLSFASDYITGAHPEILNKLVETNMESMSGYGSDRFSVSAIEKIKEACGTKDAQVFLLTGGTQTNQIIISTMLQNYEGVVAAETGHVSVHEAGAVEYTGHKVLALSAKDGKMDPEELNHYIGNFYADENHEHMVFPGMVYISYPTEYGTLYSRAELERIYEVCKNYNIPLFIDGARLGYGLCSKECDITLPELAKLCDVFYIGGTKVGALCGEAVVFTHNNAPKYFMTQVKQHGALLAKGRLLGIQFDVLFTDNLYMNISRHAIEMAEELKKVFKDKNYKFFIDSPTNQQFIILENEILEKLCKLVQYSFWEKYDDTHTVVRFATSWSTTREDIAELAGILKEI